MAIHFYKKIGKMTIEQSGKKYKIGIWTSNGLACFNSECKKENGKIYYGLYFFINDAAHAKRIIKNEGSLFGDKVLSIELNFAYDSAKKLANILVDAGYKVTCYKKQEK